MLTHAIAHEGCTDTVGESALEVDSWRKISCRTGKSNLPQRRAGSTLYQLSYIPSLQSNFYFIPAVQYQEYFLLSDVLFQCQC